MNPKPIAAAAILAVTLSSATALATAGAAPGHHATQARAGAYAVTASVNKTEPLVGSKVKIKGTVTPAAPGSKVTIEVKYEDQKSWKSIGHATLNGAGKFKFKDKITSVRQRTYRVVKPAGQGHAAGRANTKKVTVFGWRPLTSLSPVLSEGMGETSNVNINGTSYPDSIVSNSTMAGLHIDYNLNRDCKLLEARYGLSDASPAIATASLSLVVDNATRYAGSFGLTQSALVTTDLTRAFRITINAAVTYSGIAAVGSPRVLCSF
jgi:hypothetical protein